MYEPIGSGQEIEEVELIPEMEVEFIRFQKNLKKALEYHPKEDIK